MRGPRTAMKSGPRLLQLERALARKRRPNIAINQSINKSSKKKVDPAPVSGVVIGAKQSGEGSPGHLTQHHC